MQVQQTEADRLFFNSISSPYSRKQYGLYLQKYLDIYGYSDLDHLARTGQDNPKLIENQVIQLIIGSKERGMKRTAIGNYTRPILAFCKIMDIVLNVPKINKYLPHHVKSQKTYPYSHSQIHSLLDIADERMSAAILLLSSSGQRIGGLVGLTTSSLEDMGDVFKITVYEGEGEEYVTFCSSEAKSSLENYFSIRRRHGEVITPNSPVIREQYDRKDHFAVTHPKHVKETTLAIKLVDLAEAAGIRTRVKLSEGQKAANIRQDIPITNGMRRFFSSTLVKSSVQSELRFLLEGHNLKFNDSAYVHVSTEDLLAQYMKAHDNLLISQEHKLRTRVEKLEIERTEIQALALELDKIKKATGIS